MSPPIGSGDFYWMPSTAENPSSALNLTNTKPWLRPLHLVVREPEFCGLRLAGEFRRRTRENGGNSVRRSRHASLTDRNCEGFCRPGNRGGLRGLHGGAEGIQTDGHRGLNAFGSRDSPESQRRSFWSPKRSIRARGISLSLSLRRIVPILEAAHGERVEDLAHELVERDGFEPE